MAPERRFVRGLAAGLGGLLFVAAGGCGDDDPAAGVRLVLSTTVSVPEAVDEVVVQGTASRTPSGQTCQAARRTFALAGPGDLPIRVLWELGPEYRTWVAFRVTWRKAGLDRLTRTVLQPADAEEVREVRIELEAACLSRSCGPGEQCVAGTCAPVPAPDPFDPSLVVPGVDCAAPR